jgi:hypothetical protein
MSSLGWSWLFDPSYSALNWLCRKSGQAVRLCDRRQRVRRCGSIDFHANRRLPKHDIADMLAMMIVFLRGAVGVAR